MFCSILQKTTQATEIGASLLLMLVCSTAMAADPNQPWSNRCIRAGDALKDATEQIHRLSTYTSSPDRNMELIASILVEVGALSDRAQLIGRSIEDDSCFDLQENDIIEFQHSVSSLKDELTAKGISSSPSMKVFRRSGTGEIIRSESSPI